MPDHAHRRSSAAVLVIFFFSGVSGLVYQVIWVRQFGNIFGNTVHSASLVSGVFMAGLGAGAYWLGGASDRAFREDALNRRPLRMYALAELAIALFGLGLAFVLPRLGSVSAATSGYVHDARGWNVLSAGSHALRYLVAVALIAPATFLMGGTLTLLIRFVVASSLERATRLISYLYAANTLGAALGALLTDLVLVPTLGIRSTQLVAVGINAVAGVAALALSRGASPAPPVETLGHCAKETAREEPSGRGVGATALALVLAGFSAMGLEILWFRHLSSVLGERRAVFSLLLAVILVGIAAGAASGAWLQRRVGRPALLLLAAECLFAVTTLACLGAVHPWAINYSGLADLKPAFDAAPPWKAAMLELWASLRPIAAVVLVPAIFMGVSFPLANANVQRAVASVGHRAGLLYLANTLGNVAGCALVGFVLLPAFGMQRTALVLAGAAAASAIPLYLSARPFAGEREARQASAVLAVALGTATIVMSAFAALPVDRLALESFPFDQPIPPRRVLDIREGLTETVAVTKIPGLYRELFTNGHSMSTTSIRAQRYMRSFAHVPLLQMEHPTSALVICFGVGSTTNAVSLHAGLIRIDLADLSQNILEHADWFASTNHHVLRDPRVSVFVNDGRLHLLMQPEGTYDLITLEPPPIAQAGVAALYSREFYELARSRLTAGGYLTQWLPAYQLPEDQVRAAVRAFLDVFPESVLLSGDMRELILMGTRGPSIRMDTEAVARRLASEPAVADDLARVDIFDLADLAGMFAASHETMVRATRAVAPVTDDRPSMEYGVRSLLRDLEIPKDLFDVTGIDAWCPGCAARLPGLADYLRVWGHVYASEAFRVTSLAHARHLDFAAMPGMASVLPSSRYLQLLLLPPAALAKETARDDLHAGRLEDAEEGLETARAFDPDDPETYDLLAGVFTAMGKPTVAAHARDVAKGLRARGAAPPAVSP